MKCPSDTSDENQKIYFFNTYLIYVENATAFASIKAL